MPSESAAACNRPAAPSPAQGIDNSIGHSKRQGRGHAGCRDRRRLRRECPTNERLLAPRHWPGGSLGRSSNVGIATGRASSTICRNSFGSLPARAISFEIAATSCSLGILRWARDGGAAGDHFEGGVRRFSGSSGGPRRKILHRYKFRTMRRSTTPATDGVRKAWRPTRRPADHPVGRPARYGSMKSRNLQHIAREMEMVGPAPSPRY